MTVNPKPKRRLPRPFRIVLTVGIIVAILAGVYFWTVGMGHESLRKIAQEQGLCSDDACADGFAAMYRYAGETYGVSSPLLDWCLGTDEWAAARVTRGAWLRDIAVWFMYLPCSALLPEDEKKTLPVIAN